MILEDDRLFALDLASHLPAYGIEIVGIAGSRSDALEVASAGKPSLALIDVRLHQDDGLAIARELVAMFGITTLIISAYGWDYVSEDLEGLSPIGFLEKPVMPQEVGRYVANKLNTSMASHSTAANVNAESATSVKHRIQAVKCAHRMRADGRLNNHIGRFVAVNAREQVLFVADSFFEAEIGAKNRASGDGEDIAVIFIRSEQHE